MNAMTPSRELSDAVLLAVAFAERGSLPERPTRIVTAKAKKAHRLTAADFVSLEPRALRGLAEAFALVDVAGRP